MNSVERVKSICKERKIPISKLEKDLGYSNGYIGQLRKGVFPADRLRDIANYLEVSENFLMTGDENKEAPTVPGVKITFADGTTKTFDVSSLTYSIMEALSKMPDEQQELVNNMVGGKKKKKTIVVVKNPYSSYLNAAHDRTDVEITEEDRQNDEDMLD